MKQLLITFLIVFLAARIMAQEHSKRFLALGDSYTIGEAVGEDERWPVQLVNALKEKGNDFAQPTIIATTGWRTDDLRKAIARAKLSGPYDLVSLLIGVNNQYQHKPIEVYEREFEELLKLAVDYAGADAKRVIVLSIPDYGYTPFGKEKQGEISRELDLYNAINKRIAKKYKVAYIDITPISRGGLTDPSLVATDGLHPSGKMYKAWVSEILRQYTFR